VRGRSKRYRTTACGKSVHDMPRSNEVKREKRENSTREAIHPLVAWTTPAARRSESPNQALWQPREGRAPLSKEHGKEWWWKYRGWCNTNMVGNKNKRMDAKEHSIKEDRLQRCGVR
jgi:hypothetical protein